MSEQSKNGTPWWRNDPWYGGDKFYENRCKFPVEELMKYKGQYVAWFPDGSGIFDSDADPITLEDRISATGDEVAMYPIEHITDETYI